MAHGGEKIALRLRGALELAADALDLFLLELEIVGELLVGKERLGKRANRYPPPPANAHCDGLQVQFPTRAVGLSPDVGFRGVPIRKKHFEEWKMVGQIDQAA